ncbi:hypothetical protein [Crateriforma conspicua]|uniref:Uncharacterized protein n=1 Tax=Crateriforma conspicua TaxID=2527996 RepID=A0A5C6FR66_9PLAN|nr:hypothetical protein [Crateriforma conspicua]TWU63058.1 hypothetical protein V7x_47960 [Crateriforma conspicua]
MFERFLHLCLILTVLACPALDRCCCAAAVDGASSLGIGTNVPAGAAFACDHCCGCDTDAADELVDDTGDPQPVDCPGDCHDCICHGALLPDAVVDSTRPTDLFHFIDDNDGLDHPIMPREVRLRRSHDDVGLSIGGKDRLLLQCTLRL